MMKIEVRGASCRVGFNKVLSGSVLKSTVNVRWKSVMTYLRVESDEPREKIAALIANAKRACPAETLITQQVALLSYVDLNGQPLEIAGMTTDRKHTPPHEPHAPSQKG